MGSFSKDGSDGSEGSEGKEGASDKLDLPKDFPKLLPAWPPGPVDAMPQVVRPVADIFRF